MSFKEILLLFFLAIILSCNSVAIKTNRENTSQIDSSRNNFITAEQELAFDALNSLQVLVRGEHIYSTFPGIDHDCYPSDTTFVISRDHLIMAMKRLVDKYGQNISEEDRQALVITGASAQEEYVVEHCYITKVELFPDQSNIQEDNKHGKWILPNILNKRDLILEW